MSMSWGSVRDSSVIELKYIYSCPDSSWSFYYGGAGVPQYCKTSQLSPAKSVIPLDSVNVLILASRPGRAETNYLRSSSCTPLAGKSQPGITGLNFSGNGSMPSELCFDGCAYSTDFAVGLTGRWFCHVGCVYGSRQSLFSGSIEPTLDCPSGEVPTADGKGCESNCFQCVETPAGKCVKSTSLFSDRHLLSNFANLRPSADQQKEGDKECGPAGCVEQYNIESYLKILSES